MPGLSRILTFPQRQQAPDDANEAVVAEERGDSRGYIPLVLEERTGNEVYAEADGRSKKLRVGVALALLAIVAAAMKVVQSRSSAATQAGDVNAYQEKYAKPIGLCTPYKGILFAPTKACCASSCGPMYCGAPTCHLGPGGPFGCCTAQFGALCGSVGVNAPCLIPKMMAGATQIVGENLASLAADGEKALMATTSHSEALGLLMGIRAGDITSALDNTTYGGRRLNQQSVNMNYVIHLPTASLWMPQTVAALSVHMKMILQNKMNEKGLTSFVLADVAMPLPVWQSPDTDPALTTTLHFETMTTSGPPPTTPTTTTTAPAIFMGLLMIDVDAADAVVTSQASRDALAAAIATVVGVPVSSVTILGEGHGPKKSDGTETVNGGYKIEVPPSMTSADIHSKEENMKSAIQAQFTAHGVSVTVKDVRMGTPQLVTTTTTSTPEPKGASSNSTGATSNKTSSSATSNKTSSSATSNKTSS